MRFLLLLLISIPTFSQSNLSSLPEEYIIKTDGTLKYVTSQKLNEITSIFSLENGTLIKPEGIIVLKSGKEIVIKNGEMIDQFGTLTIAPDSLINYVRFRNLFNKINELEKRQSKIAEINLLILEKTRVLEELCKSMILKSTELAKRKRNKESKDLQLIVLRIKSIESEIADLENQLKSLSITYPSIIQD